MISTSVPSARRQWVKSDCQTSFGAAASNRIGGAARALARFGHDQPGGVEDAPDGRGRRDGQALALEVPGDRGRARVETMGGELRAEGDDPDALGVGCPVRAGVRSAGAWINGVESAVPVPMQEPVQVPAADPELGRGGGHGQLR